MIDDQGRNYRPLAAAGTPLTRPLIPGESYDSEFQFELGGDAAGLKLLITTREWEERLMIGDENSLAHKKTYFAVPPFISAAGAGT